MREKFIAFILFFFGVYYYLITSFLGGAKIFDELLILFLVFPILGRIRTFKVKKEIYSIIKLLVLFTCLGLFSSFLYLYQPNIISCKGSVVYYKNFIPFIYIVLCCNSSDLDFDLLNRKIYQHFKISLFLIILGVFYQLVFKLQMTDYIGILPRFSSFFSPKSSYGIVASFLTVVLFYLYGNNYIKVRAFLIPMFLLFFSFRVKAIVLTAILIAFLYVKKKMLSIRVVLVFVIILIGISTSDTLVNLFQRKFTDAFTSTTEDYSTARSMLYLKSFDVAYDHFPFGAGFGTYGTHFSSVRYSPLYDNYGLSGVFGLSKDQNSFINDTQWPPILAETGFIGLVLYLLVFFSIFKLIYYAGDKYYLRNQLILCFLLLFVNSTGTSIFFNSGSAAIYVLLGIIYLNKLSYDATKFIVK